MWKNDAHLIFYKFIFSKFDLYFIIRQPLSKYVVYKKLQKIKNLGYEKLDKFNFNFIPSVLFKFS